MKRIEEFLSDLTDEKQKYVQPIIDYIYREYPNVQFKDKFGPNTIMPSFWIDDKYIALACRKHYFTIHFSNRDSVKFIKENYEYSKANVGCVNFPYHRPLPYILLSVAIDKTLDV